LVRLGALGGHVVADGTPTAPGVAEGPYRDAAYGGPVPREAVQCPEFTLHCGNDLLGSL